jgi:integrase
MRTVPIADGTVMMLRARRARALQLALAYGVPFGYGHAYVLSSAPGGLVPLSPARLSDKWRWAAKKAGTLEADPETGKRRRIPVPIRFHDLRHFTVSRWLDGNVPIPQVVELAGWTSPQMLGVYGHAVQGEDRRSADAIGDVLDDLRGSL